MVRAYIDTCCLQRPLDDQTQPRIRVETEPEVTNEPAAETRGATDATRRRVFDGILISQGALIHPSAPFAEQE